MTEKIESLKVSVRAKRNSLGYEWFIIIKFNGLEIKKTKNTSAYYGFYKREEALNDGLRALARLNLLEVIKENQCKK